jgi:hypothetical protein
MELGLHHDAVACKHWRWLPGMRGHDRGRTFVVISAAQDSYTVRFDLPVKQPRRRPPLDLWRFERSGGPPALPRLTDPATVGCLLALVREAWDVGYGENKYAYIAVNPPVTPMENGHLDSMAILKLKL